MAVDESLTLMSRIRQFFRRSKYNGDFSEVDDGSDDLSDSESTALAKARPGVVRPWNRNNAVLSQVQEGFQSLTELMTAIRQGMDSQSVRQEQLMQHLSALPRVLESIPESNRLQSETLKAICDQLVHQADQQHVLGEILQRMSDSDNSQRELLESLRQRMDTLSEQDKAVAESLNSVGAAVQSASNSSVATTEVLTNLRENLKKKDNDLEKALTRQGDRFARLLSVAIFILVAALVAVLIAVMVIGFLVLRRNGAI